MSFKYLEFFLNWFVILFCVNDLKMAIYKVYAFCAGQKFDASTISGLIIILYPVAKWILVKVFLKKIQTWWIKMIKKSLSLKQLNH
jgi:hypothetical protein